VFAKLLIKINLYKKGKNGGKPICNKKRILEKTNINPFLYLNIVDKVSKKKVLVET
jgi:hypothetical protein